MERNKGARIEREIVNMLREAGIDAERVPLSGASHYRDEGHDINVYVWGRSKPPLVFEIKARKEGSGFTLLKRWLGGHDGLVTRENRCEPLVTFPWHVVVNLIVAASRSTATPLRLKGMPDEGTSARPAGSGRLKDAKPRREHRGEDHETRT
jgi:hypothetical protein